MELERNRKRIGYAFGIFMGFMLLCTLISRAVYAGALPQITAEKPERKNITHKVQTEGIVEPGIEYALNTPGGLRCRTVLVHTGDSVTPDTLLFEIDTEDLKEQIEEQELAIEKLKLAIGDQENNRSLEAEQKQLENDRAKEDYDRTKQEGDAAVERAEDALRKAQTALEELENHPAGENAPEDQEQEEQLEASAENAKEEYEKIREKIEELAKEEPENPVKKPDDNSEDSAKEEWEEEKRALEKEVEAAKAALEEAKNSREQALLEAERKVDDTKLPSQADSSLKTNRLELLALQKKLEKYEEILEAEGKIYAEEEGVITKIQVSPGERIPDGASLVYADLDSPLEFHFSLTKEQKKYVNSGDGAKLTLEGRTIEVNADYIQQSAVSSELFDVTIFLPEGVGKISQSGSFVCEQQSEVYSCVIPIDALEEDQNGRKYVYILSERSGILGAELVAEQVYVNVLDQNDSDAAIEEGVIDSNTQVIVNSTKTLEDRAVVRYKE